MTTLTGAMTRNIALYRWSRFLRNLMFWQAVWFLYFQTALTPAQAILLYAVYDVATTLLEVPSGYMSDRLGRRITLLASAVAGALGALLLATGQGLPAFAAGQVLIGASMAFASGTEEALLYESLVANGQGDQIERQELVAWRYSFTALALSAVTGGAMAMVWPALPFHATALALVALIGVTWRFAEPPRATGNPGLSETLDTLRTALRQPVLRWIFALSVLMYGFSHLPFIFGQPFILQALERTGLAAQAPVVSGGVSTTMMLVSLTASFAALWLRQRLGLAAILLLAFGMQIGLAGVLALSNAAWVIGILFLRMVPDALSRPFIIARIQPLLADQGRATFLSVKSLTGRLLFAGSLALAAGSAGGTDALPYDDIQRILGWYVLAGTVLLAALWIAARPLAIDPGRPVRRATGTNP